MRLQHGLNHFPTFAYLDLLNTCQITDEAKLENYVVPPMYGEDAGLVGALTLSAEGHQRTARRPSTWPILYAASEIVQRKIIPLHSSIQAARLA